MPALSLSANFCRDLLAASLEFVGTTLFLLLGLGGIQAVTAEKASSAGHVTDVDQALYIATCMGFSLVVCAWIFFRYVCPPSVQFRL